MNTTHPDWTMEDIYNMLMFDIEPELMTDVIPTLDSAYKNETKQQKKDRMTRYAKAFEEFSRRFDAFIVAWRQEMLKAHGAGITYAKEYQNAKDKSDVAGIERSIEEHDA